MASKADLERVEKEIKDVKAGQQQMLGMLELLCKQVGINSEELPGANAAQLEGGFEAFGEVQRHVGARAEARARVGAPAEVAGPVEAPPESGGAVKTASVCMTPAILFLFS